MPNDNWYLYTIDFPLVVLVLCLTCCMNVNPPKEGVFIIAKVDDASYEAAERVSSLPPLDNTTVNTYTGYKEIADRINQMIKFLNREANAFNIPELDTTIEGYDKISKVVTELTPLVNSYNGVVLSSKKVVRTNPDSLIEFQAASSRMALEVGLIYYATGYKASYDLVGFAYRSVGLNRLAFKCPTCVETILSDAHWFIRDTFVEETGKQLEYWLTEAGNYMKGMKALQWQSVT